MDALVRSVNLGLPDLVGAVRGRGAGLWDRPSSVIHEEVISGWFGGAHFDNQANKCSPRLHRRLKAHSLRGPMAKNHDLLLNNAAAFCWCCDYATPML